MGFSAAFASPRETLPSYNCRDEGNTVTQEIVDGACKVHKVLGPGLLESFYEAALAWELEKRGLRVTRQQAIPEQVHIHTGFFADLIVNDQIIVEIKAVESIQPVHRRQLLTYLKLADKRLGLLLNFNVVPIEDGIIRRASGLKE